MAARKPATPGFPLGEPNSRLLATARMIAPAITHSASTRAAVTMNSKAHLLHELIEQEVCRILSLAQCDGRILSATGSAVIPLRTQFEIGALAMTSTAMRSALRCGFAGAEVASLWIEREAQAHEQHRNGGGGESEGNGAVEQKS